MVAASLDYFDVLSNCFHEYRSFLQTKKKKDSVRQENNKDVCIKDRATPRFLSSLKPLKMKEAMCGGAHL